MSYNEEIQDKNNIGREKTFSSEDDQLKFVGCPDVSEEAEESRERIFDRISQRIERPGEIKAPVRRLYWRWTAAASVLILLMAGLSYYIYNLGYKSGIQKLAATTIEVYSSQGTISTVILPDSSEVILNSGSTLYYPSFFEENRRQVKLEGEGYFRVKKDTAKPFIVNTAGMDVKVLGTVFNLKSFPGDDLVWLTLEEGSVLAKNNTSAQGNEILLSPDDQVTLNKITGEMTSKKVFAGQYTFWINGGFYFRNNSLEEIVMALEKKFDVEIVIKNEKLKKETFFCQFDKDDGLDRILYLLSNKSNWQYLISGNQVIIDH